MVSARLASGTLASPARTQGCLIAVAVLALCALSAPRAVRADDLDDVRRTKTLVWGADMEGGGPYVFPRDDDPEQIAGFEVELADRLASYLEVKAQFSQGDWSRMPDLLRARKVQIIINGYEWDPVRAEAMEASIPYYVYGLQLLVRKEDSSLASFADLRTPRPGGGKRRVGVLGGSAAEAYMVEHFGDTVELASYDGVTGPMREVENDKLDATLQDTPIVSFYSPRFPGLRILPEVVGPGYYVAFARKGETALITAVNEALLLMIKNGDLERIYRRYQMWNAQQAELGAIAGAARFYGYARVANVAVEQGEIPSQEEVRVEARKTGMAVVREYGLLLVQSAGMTVVLAVLAFPCAIFLGLLIAIGRVYGPRWLATLLGFYVEFLRGTPLMLQLYFIFFFLPELGITIPAFTTGVLGLAVNYSAYEAEIYRAGLQAIPGGQMEAALSLGMSRALAIRRVIVPQAVRIVIPPVVNDFIALFKDTSVCSVVTIVELTKRYSILSMSTQATLELMALTAILYLATRAATAW